MTRIIFEVIIQLLLKLSIDGALSSDHKKLLKQAISSIVEKRCSHFQIGATIGGLIDTCDAPGDCKEKEKLLKRISSILKLSSDSSEAAKLLAELDDI